MKRDFLDSLGIEKELIDKIMSEHGKTIETYKAQIESHKSRLSEVSEQLKAFDGINVNEMKSEFERLKNDMVNKEAEYQKQLADRDFQSILESSILSANGKNSKAIMAMLNLDELRQSQNQREDIQTAIKAVYDTDSYLFNTQPTESIQSSPISVSTGGAHKEIVNLNMNSNDAMNAFIRGKTNNL